MKIAVYGTGALGGFFGAKLAQSGHDVTFIARGRTLQALRTDGLTVESSQGDIRLPQVRATDKVASVGPVDVVLMTMKAGALDEAAQTLPPLITAHTAVLTMQNGVEAPSQVAAVTGEGRVMPCVVRVFAKIKEPGVIQHMGGPGSVAFAEWSNRSTTRVHSLRDAFYNAEVKVIEPPDIWVELWEKFAFVVPLGTLGSLTGEPISVLRTALRDEFAAMVDEIAAVGRAKGVKLADNITERTLAFADQQPPESTSSLQRDVLAGLPSELDALVGAGPRLGRELGVPTPKLDLAYAVLERKARS